MSESGMADTRMAEKRLAELEAQTKYAQEETSDRPTVNKAMAYIDDRIERLDLQVEKLEAMLASVREDSDKVPMDRNVPTAVHPGPPVVRQLFEQGQRISELTDRLFRMQAELSL